MNAYSNLVLSPQRERQLKWFLAALVVIGFILRIVSVDGRALHHDESLDAWFSQRFYDGTYEGYDPVYHGPLRFYITAFFYWLFGISVGSARLISVIAGSAIIALPWVLRHRVGVVAAGAMGAILCFSPSFIYFSRFAREDAFFALISLGLIVVLFSHINDPTPNKLLGLLLVLVAGWAVKESVFLLVLVVGSFVLVELASQLRGPDDPFWDGPIPTLSFAIFGVAAFVFGEPIILWMALWGGSMLATVGHGLVRGKVKFADTPIGRATVLPGISGWLVALGVAGIAFAALFTVFFTTWSGSNTPSTGHNAVLDGLVGGWDYWRSQQDVNRGGEPWFYYLYVIPLYEYVAVALAGVGFYSEMKRSTLIGRFAVFGSIVTTAAYSYAGERMPWLVVHPLLPITVLAGIGVSFLWRHRNRPTWKYASATVVVMALLSIPATVRVNYVDGENPAELLSQAGQASPELAESVDRMYRLDELIRAQYNRPLRLVIDSSDSASWPYVFYFRDLESVSYRSLESGVSNEEGDVFIVVDRNLGVVQPSLAGFTEYKQQHREWWIVPYSDGIGTGWPGWLIDASTWTETGGLSETVFLSPTAAETERLAEELSAPN